MWQADPETLDALVTVLRAGCRTADAVVTCPPEATESPGYLGWRATLEERDGDPPRPAAPAQSLSLPRGLHAAQ